MMEFDPQILWPLCGAIGHVIGVSRLKSVFGNPPWRDFSTYFMFIPAMALGPLIILMFVSGVYDDD